MTRTEFYNTKGWKQNRTAYALSKGCICEACGRPVYVSGINSYLPKNKRLRYVVHHKEHLNDENYTSDLAYDWNNLELLCIECHNRIHGQQVTKDGFVFDGEGNFVEQKIIKRTGGSEINPPH